jgi:uncharacterized protein YgiM (DUF1202 family)
MSNTKNETERDIYDVAADNKDKGNNYGFVAKDTLGVYGVVISKTGLNLRQEPNAGSDIFRVLAYSAKVEISETLDGWYKVMAKNGDVGYCMSEFIEVK